MRQRIYAALCEQMFRGGGGLVMAEKKYALLRGSIFDEPTYAAENRWRQAVHEIGMAFAKLAGLDDD